MTLLSIENLTVAYRANGRFLNAVRDFSLQIDDGQIVGLVGESGSGKTTVALALMRYLAGNGEITNGRILLNGRDLAALSLAEMRAVWGRQIGMVPQNPGVALNPSIRIGEQLVEGLRQWEKLGKRASVHRAAALLTMTRVANPEEIIRAYPHQLSGGMQQRVLIAMALSAEPALLVLDEPTTSLDATTQAVILDLLRDLIRTRNTAVLYVTHNLGVVANLCDRVAVLYAGELVEEASSAALFARPNHPYTQGLLASVPLIGGNKTGGALQAIAGQIPALTERRTGGCVFAPRCPAAVARCVEERPSLTSVDNHRVRCHLWEDGAMVKTNDSASGVPHRSRAATHRPPLLAVENLRVHFQPPKAFAAASSSAVKAVNGVNLSVENGQTLGIVGESGSGKTTMARAILGLANRTGGEVTLLGSVLPAALRDRKRETLRRLQYVFQNPEEALNPQQTVGEILQRPFIALNNQSKEEAAARVEGLLTAVQLPLALANRRPAQLSGGEKQRVAIARAFATNPNLLIADESVSSLDVSVQAAILNLLTDLQTDHDTSLLFISHDLAVVGYIADRIAVIYAGQIMEVADAGALFKPPFHPYTEALLSAIPSPDPAATQSQIRLDGDPPNPANLPSGCPFHPRCPRFYNASCQTTTPAWQETAVGDRIFCHVPLPELIAMQQKPS